MSDGTGSGTVLTTAAFIADVADVERESGVADTDATSAAASAAQCEEILEEITGLVGSGAAVNIAAQLAAMATYEQETTAAAATASAAVAQVQASATEAGNSATLAQTEAAAATASAAAAAASAANALTQANNAASSAAAATGASISNLVGEAEAAATQSASSATASAASATQAAASAANALAAEANVAAASGSASAAAGSATAAQASATAAANSATAALNAAALITSVTLNYLISFTLTGLLAASESIPYPVAVGMSLPAGLTGSKFVALVAATAASVITLVHVSGSTSTNIGTLSWAAGATVPSVTFTSPVSFAIGDVLVLETAATPDTTLAGIGVTLLGQI